MLTDGSLDTGVRCARADFVVGDDVLLIAANNSSVFRLLDPCLPSVQKVEEDQDLEDSDFGFYGENAIVEDPVRVRFGRSINHFDPIDNVCFTCDIIRDYADIVAKFVKDFFPSMLTLTCSVVFPGALRMRTFIFLTLPCIRKLLYALLYIFADLWSLTRV